MTPPNVLKTLRRIRDAAESAANVLQHAELYSVHELENQAEHLRAIQKEMDHEIALFKRSWTLSQQRNAAKRAGQSNPNPVKPKPKREG